MRPRNNNFTIEGVDNNDKSVTGPLVPVPNDAVDQFTVLQNQFAPEFGHSSGGQFNQTIKSGTNQFHGRLYEYFQNRNLNAQDVKNVLAQEANGEKPSNPRYDNNRWGGQVGGPIIKNRLFFFRQCRVQLDRSSWIHWHSAFPDGGRLCDVGQPVSRIEQPCRAAEVCAGGE